jgi:hypothetical protein
MRYEIWGLSEPSQDMVHDENTLKKPVDILGEPD